MSLIPKSASSWKQNVYQNISKDKQKVPMPPQKIRWQHCTKQQSSSYLTQETLWFGLKNTGDWSVSKNKTKTIMVIISGSLYICTCLVQTLKNTLKSKLVHVFWGKHIVSDVCLCIFLLSESTFIFLKMRPHLFYLLPKTSIQDSMTYRKISFLKLGYKAGVGLFLSFIWKEEMGSERKAGFVVGCGEEIHRIILTVKTTWMKGKATTTALLATLKSLSISS